MKTLWIIVLLIVQVPVVAHADYLVTNRKTSLKAEPSSASEVVLQVEQDQVLTLFDNGAQQSGYYRVRYGSIDGFIYRTFVSRRTGNVPANTMTAELESESPAPADPTLEVAYRPKVVTGDKLVVHDGFVSCMSTEFNVPKWVFEKVSYSLLQGETQTRPGSYPKDEAYPKLKTKAYESSGYDHGHLAPAADFKRDTRLYDESFLMTNMSPQHGCLNQKGWCLLESNVRDWAEKFPASEFYVFSGSIVDENTNDWLCIGDVTVTVPSAFFKVVAERKNGKFIKGVAYLMANGDVDGTEVESTRTTIDEIERVTGLNFFPNMTAAVESKVEAREGDFIITDLSECAKRNSPCSKVYGSRVLPENRKKLLCEDE